MIGGCIISISYPFKADLYLKIRTQKPSGQLDYKWQFSRTVNCLVSPFLSTSFRLQGITEQFGAEYTKVGFLRMLSGEEIGADCQITNIRNETTNVVIYKELELKTTPATWFNTNGSSPILDPFGTPVQFENLLTRAQTQGEISV